jgi:hypothetical protein
MKHKVLLDIRDDAVSAGCWSSIENILGFEGEEMPRSRKKALREAQKNLIDLAAQALDFAQRCVAAEDE